MITYQKRWKLENPKKQARYEAAYRARNPEAVRERQRAAQARLRAKRKLEKGAKTK